MYSRSQSEYIPKFCDNGGFWTVCSRNTDFWRSFLDALCGEGGGLHRAVPRGCSDPCVPCSVGCPCQRRVADRSKTPHL